MSPSPEHIPASENISIRLLTETERKTLLAARMESYAHYRWLLQAKAAQLNLKWMYSTPYLEQWLHLDEDVPVAESHFAGCADGSLYNAQVELQELERHKQADDAEKYRNCLIRLADKCGWEKKDRVEYWHLEWALGISSSGY